MIWDNGNWDSEPLNRLSVVDCLILFAASAGGLGCLILVLILSGVFPC